MSHHRRLQDQMSFEIPIPKDENGMIGRECPEKDCLGYFKIKLGTGLTGDDLPCTCPYCGHKGPHDTFWTQDQLEYGKSVAIRQVAEIVVGELKDKLECRIPARGPFGIGLSVTVERGSPRPIRYYREKELETGVVCSSCALQYSIYGVFGFCPDCGIHNSLQILQKNLELARKELDLAAQATDVELREHLIGDALENAVSSFDGFGRELAGRFSQRATLPAQAAKLSFQNLQVADDRIYTLFGFRLSSSVQPSEWSTALRSFQKRHLLSHKMGVIDDQYIAATQDPTAVVGRRIQFSSDEVRETLRIVEILGQSLAAALT